MTGAVSGVPAEATAAVAKVLADWGIRSRHGEWTDAETQHRAASDALAAALPALREGIAAEVLGPDKIERQYACVVTAILRVLDDTEWDGWPEPAKWRLRQRIVNAVRDAVKSFAAPVSALSAPMQAAEEVGGDGD